MKHLDIYRYRNSGDRHKHKPLRTHQGAQHCRSKERLVEVLSTKGLCCLDLGEVG
jgi:hypothetical protein